MFISLTQIVDKIIHIKQTWKALRYRLNIVINPKMHFNLKRTLNKDDSFTLITHINSLKTKAHICKNDL